MLMQRNRPVLSCLDRSSIRCDTQRFDAIPLNYVLTTQLRDLAGPGPRVPANPRHPATQGHCWPRCILDRARAAQDQPYLVGAEGLRVTTPYLLWNWHRTTNERISPNQSLFDRPCAYRFEGSDPDIHHRECAALLRDESRDTSLGFIIGQRVDVTPGKVSV